ncbi:unnamed protein product [Tenebrio molitor]|nr:unnamed protein product [Tenebrio molitor]
MSELGTWNKSGQMFGITGDDAVKHFKGLREKYLRIKRKKAEAERSGAGAYCKENWHLFELLRFLDEVS